MYRMIQIYRVVAFMSSAPILSLETNTAASSVAEDGAEAGKELLMVLGVFEDGALLYASDDDVMEGAGSIDACLAGHGESMAREAQNVNMSPTSPNVRGQTNNILFQFKLPLSFPSFIFCLRFVEKLLLFFSAYN